MSSSPSKPTLTQERQGAQLFIWSMFWTLGTKYGGKIVNLLTTIVLAWLLAKEDFGLAGYALVFVTFIEIFEGFGVESALVYNDEDKELQDNAFWIGAAAGLAITATIFFAAPLAGYVFNDERAVPLVQLLSLTFFFTGARIVPKALVTKRMQFRKLAIPEFTKVIIKGIVAISFAFGGLGAWSLIASVVIAMFFEFVAFWMISDWRPSFRFHNKPEKIRPLLSYGGGMIGLSVIGTLVENIDYVLVGRHLGAAALGVYSLGYRLPTLLISPIIESLSRVLFPFSVNAAHEQLVSNWKHSLRYILLFSVPVGFGLAAVSPAMVPALFGEKWLEAVPVVSAISLQVVITTVYWHTGDIYKAIGRISVLFWMSLVHLAIVVPLVVWAVYVVGDVAMVAFAHALSAFLFMLVRLWHMSRLMQMPLTQIGTVVLHPFVAGLVMAVVVVLVDQRLAAAEFSNWSRLAIDIPVGALVYSLMAWWLMKSDIQTAVQQLKQGRRGGVTAQPEGSAIEADVETRAERVMEHGP